MEQPNHNPGSAAPVYWRVEGSLADLTTVRPIAFFTWNAQTFLERWVRRGLVLVMAVLRPFLYAAHRIFATRVVHTVLRGISRDRLDLLGEEYFKYKLQPYLKADGMEALKARIEAGRRDRPGEPGTGPRDASAGAAPGREVADRQSPGVPRRHRHRAFAGTGGAAARSCSRASAAPGPTADVPPERLVRDLGLPDAQGFGVRRDSGRAPDSRCRSGRLFISMECAIPARSRFAGRSPASTSC